MSEARFKLLNLYDQSVIKQVESASLTYKGCVYQVAYQQYAALKAVSACLTWSNGTQSLQN